MESTTRPDPVSGVPTYFERPAVGNVFEIAGRFILFESNGADIAGLAEFLDAHYCTAVQPSACAAPDATISWKLQDQPRQLDAAFQQFEISGGGLGSTDGRTCMFDFKNACVVAYGDQPRRLEVLMRRVLDLRTREDLQVMNYAISTVLRRCGLFELHSGAVVNPQNQRGVLLVGPSGSGKSTLTLQLVLNGWRYLTDDVLFLKPDDNTFKAYPLRRTFAVTQSTVEASGNRVRDVFAGDDWFEGDKKSFVPHEIFPETFLSECEPRAIVFPAITGTEESVVKPLTRGETMAQLIKMSPWSCYDPVTSADHLQALSALARQCDGFSLLAGKDLLKDSTRASELMLEYTSSSRQQ
jgi:hypothetical protein